MNCLTDRVHVIVLSKPVGVQIWAREHLDDEIVQNANGITETGAEVGE